MFSVVPFGRARTLLVCAAVAVFAIGLQPAASASRQLAATPAAARFTANPRPVVARFNVTGGFEANRGQLDRRVLFAANGPGYALLLAATGLDIELAQERKSPSGAVPRALDNALLQSHVAEAPREALLRLGFEGAGRHPGVSGLGRLPGSVSYFMGPNQRAWRAGIPTYAAVAYRELYRGIDLTYADKGGRLEYTFLVRPGAHPSAIRMRVLGARRVAVDGEGALNLTTPVGQIREEKPFVYQLIHRAVRTIAGRYELAGRDEVRFLIGSYDRRLPLVIDPVLTFSTYLGGSSNDQGDAIAVGGAGGVYVTGTTFSSDFPTTTGAYSPTLGTPLDIFVSKFNATGTALLWSTFLGGSYLNSATGIAVDSSGDTYVTGATGSGYPTTSGAAQVSFGGGGLDAFITKLSPAGSRLLYSTYLGGSNFDSASGIAVDSSGNAYVTGTTASTNFPTASAYQNTPGGGFFDAFVAKLNAAGSALTYSTYLGGNGIDEGNGIAIDSSGDAYVTGVTSSISNTFPLVNAAQPTYGGSSDAFVTKLNPQGNGVLYSTYLGGNGFDDGGGIAVDGGGHAYVTGLTTSSAATFPLANAFQPTFGGVVDAFVAKLSVGGGGFVYSTFLGGSDFDQGRAIAVDGQDHAYVVGTTDSTGGTFPITNAVQSTYGGSGDAFITKLTAAGTGLVYSTYLGGSNAEQGTGIAVDRSDDAYVVGTTNSSNFPTTTGAFSTTLAGGSDAFVTELSP